MHYDGNETILVQDNGVVEVVVLGNNDMYNNYYIYKYNNPVINQW